MPGGNIPQEESPLRTELKSNFDYINLYYLYIDSEKNFSKNVEDYYETEFLRSYGYSRCTQNYANICYMYYQISDPFTRYYDPYYADMIWSSLTETESYLGTGIYPEEDDSNNVFVEHVTRRSPAERAGIMLNDTILAIDGTKPNSANAANKLLSGAKGDTLELTIKRDSSELIFNVTIEELKEESVSLYYEDSIPVIKIDQFISTTASDSGTYGEFIDILKKTEGAKATIIDLRDNPGGNGSQCAKVSGELLSKGDTIAIDIQTEIDTVINSGKKEARRIMDTIAYVATDDGLAKDRYIVFLANSETASCAEFMISAITSNRNAPIVGETTYGKGIGQYYFITQGYGVSFITSIQTQDHNGKVYHKLGFAPDYKTSDPKEQMAKAVEWAKERTKIREAEFGSEPNSIFVKAHRDDVTEFPTSRKEFLRQMGGMFYIKN